MDLQITPLVEHAKKRIYWAADEEKPDAEGGLATILVGYCPDTLAYFLGMFEAATKDFPELKSSDVTCGKVTKSDFIKGYTLIIFQVGGKKRDIPGWENWELKSRTFNY